MKNLHIKGYSDWICESIINENISAAKQFMLKMEADRGEKRVSELTEEEIDRALNNPAYNQIIEITKDFPGYMIAFLKFHFIHGAPIRRLRELMEVVKNEKPIIRLLSKNFDQYASQSGEHGTNGFEALTDEIRTVKRNQSAKWIVDSLPKALRDQYRNSTPEKKLILLNSAHQLNALGEASIRRFLSRLSAMTSWTFDEFLEYVSSYIKGYSTNNMDKKIQEIYDLEPEAGILYADDRYIVLSMRTETSQKTLCSVANWCLNTGRFKQYVNDAIQLNIFDFGIDSASPMFLTGTTVSYSGRVTNSSDVNNRSITKSSNLSEHLSQLGYPATLVNEVIDKIPEETEIKKAVYSLKIDTTLEPAKLLYDIMVQEYRKKISDDPVALKAILYIVKNRVQSKLTNDQILEFYTKYGVMSYLSALIFTSIFKDSDRSYTKPALDQTLDIFAKLQDLANTHPERLTGRSDVGNVLSTKDTVLNMLGLGSSDNLRKPQEVTEFRMAEPETSPAVAPPKPKTPSRPAPSRPAPSRPSPVPTKKPFGVPEPAKANAEDVIKRLTILTNEEL